MMMGEGYRFIPTAEALGAFFRRYESERRLGGMATSLVHVSPQQRIDAITTILGLNASHGWRRREGEDPAAVWLRYLTPVLAETRESVAALGTAAAQGLPGSFEPAMTATAKPEPHEAPRRPPSNWSGFEPTPWWQPLALAAEQGRAMLGDMRVLAVVAMLGLAITTYVAIYIYSGGNDPDPVALDAAKTTTASTGVDIVPRPQIDPPVFPSTEDAPLDEAGKDYRTALHVTLQAAAEENGSITPRELAEIFAGESGSIGDPAIFLDAMLHDWPLSPETPIPRTRDGAYALTRYAQTFATTERGDIASLGRPALDRLAAEDAFLRADVLAFGLGDPIGEVTTATPGPSPIDWIGTLRWLAFLPMLGVFAWTRLTRLAAFRAQLTNPPSGTGVMMELPAEALIITDPLPARRLVRQISWREPGRARRINAEASVRTTIRQGGFLTLVPRLRRRTSDFLFLVPRLRDNDHEYVRTGRQIDALRLGGLNIAAYDYDPDPRSIYRRSGSRPGEETGESVLDLRALRELHAEARLVLVTDGSELVDFLTQRPLPFLVEEFSAWPSKMLLTPVPMAEWGEREMNLSETLGLIVGRAGAGGFADLVLAFGEHPKPPPRPARSEDMAQPQSEEAGIVARVSSWLDAAEALLGARPDAARRPASVRFDDPVLSSDAAPPDEDQARLVAELRAWLGPRGFMWLAACAAYPQLRFAITLYLGLKLTVDRGPAREPIYDEALLAQLTLLPWFRTGRMPPWLRLALFAALPLPHRRRIRKAVDDMLNGAGLADLGTLPAEARLSIWREQGSGLEVPPDAVMAELLFRDRAEIDPVIKGGAFSAIFRDAALRARLVGWLALLGGFLWCLIAFLLWPSPGASPEPAGHWLPLAGFVIASLVIGAIVVAISTWRGWTFAQPAMAEAM